MSEHSREPWELSQLYPNSGLVLLRDAHDAAGRVIGEFRLREDAQHAIDCHQALAGMRPEKLKVLVEVAKKLLWQVETLHLVATGTDKRDVLCKEEVGCCICELIVAANAAL